ncbi:6-hydroxymethylpterin diphosphokinase MptE-like protein [Gloeobacter kilaueensis]|uniref:6-hydroxymethylpterin diphosphokinase MptE-like domain-containing protein n=1 Tax=Gloeobacter kilaueensis (strain ATCC BAA-2537 / CCAP 1431/1 / ULC 316 / JS1) TaxID=1183438 RepID=U5QFX7_GLOK1|nr:6-hydroxymethylpterin diphosphokinase MptE-like protein [Gloeobacter kilaueensis]AGY57852.1 hypothetical protein GKIL_1606 [Gloeobacter kilaueensis JS1]
MAVLNSQRATINPYRYATLELLRRLKWDLSAESWRSRDRLRSCLNKHSAQRAVIVCNGPSLLRSDLSLLRTAFTFGLNKINLLFAQSDFRPACIVSVNPFVIEQNQHFFNSTDIPLFLDSVGTRHVQARKNVTFLHSASQVKFARDCSISIYQGYTVTFVAMQLAFHMGFERVALIGCDHNFATKGPPNKTVLATAKDENHFDPKYFSDGMRWQLPDLSSSEAAYSLARVVFEEAGRKIVNCTEGGNLEVFERCRLKDFISA